MAKAVNIRKANKVIQATFTVDTSAYASGDVIANPVEIPKAVLGVDGVSVLQSLTLTDLADQGVALSLVFTTDATVLGTINSAPNISDANVLAKVLGVVAVGTADYLDLGGARVATLRNIGLMLQPASGKDSIFVGVVNGAGTPTFGAATDLSIRLGFERMERYE